eukprot:TRINITY_DN3266_c0_g1_i3.p2 TRINITY_DN3266_c0_g1~~TRINITY_DN3266_c0_g1_i3.p2  ORF type:complete len:258 (+),score=51.61 TRINITY_DN3266_c0_g1_i3:38-811(+)
MKHSSNSVPTTHSKEKVGKKKRWVKAVASFEAAPFDNTKRIELSFEMNDYIHLVAEAEGGWAQGSIGDRYGWFPLSYVEDVEGVEILEAIQSEVERYQSGVDVLDDEILKMQKTLDTLLFKREVLIKKLQDRTEQLLNKKDDVFGSVRQNNSKRKSKSIKSRRSTTSKSKKKRDVKAKKKLNADHALILKNPYEAIEAPPRPLALPDILEMPTSLGIHSFYITSQMKLFSSMILFKYISILKRLVMDHLALSTQVWM